MDSKFDVNLLEVGDTLLYFSGSILDWVVAIKTWTKVSHVEIYSGHKMSYASRNGQGVNQYPLRTKGLAVVLRSIYALDTTNANDWFWRKAQGQDYDWLGLLCFTLAVKQGSNNKMFCSEFWTRYMREAGGQPFNPEWDADRVPPAFCLVTPTQYIVWKHPKLTI